MHHLEGLQPRSLGYLGDYSTEKAANRLPM